jgi:hypothetical protein
MEQPATPPKNALPQGRKPTAPVVGEFPYAVTLPASITQKMVRIEAIHRSYPKDRPNHPRIHVSFQSVALAGDPIGFFICRRYQDNTHQENPFQENFYDLKHLKYALEDYQKDVLENQPVTPQRSVRSFSGAPRLTLEKKTLAPKEIKPPKVVTKTVERQHGAEFEEEQEPSLP